MALFYFIVGLLTLTIAFIDNYDKIREWNKLDKGKKATLIASLICATGIFIFTLILYFNDLDEKVRLSRTGTFQIHTGGEYIETPSLKFGVSGINFLTTNEHLSIKTPFNDLFSIRVAEGKYYLLLYLREKDGDAVASINGTQYKIYHDGYDYNYDDNGFEIVTGDLKVVFQIDYRDGAAWFSGLFYDEAGTGYYIPTTSDNWDILSPTSSFIQPAKGIKRLFKYPREEYLHERDY